MMVVETRDQRGALGVDHNIGCGGRDVRTDGGDPIAFDADTNAGTAVDFGIEDDQDHGGDPNAGPLPEMTGRFGASTGCRQPPWIAIHPPTASRSTRCSAASHRPGA